MNNYLLSFFLLVLVSACSVNQPPAYQKDRAPELRDEYNGIEGAIQYQKDQGYLMNKELSDKCTNAKIDLAIAEADKDKNEIEKQTSIINRTCRE